MDLEAGALIEGVEIGPVAHGGHFIARHQGRVLFVRHALTGEVADVRITEVRPRFARAEVVALRSRSPHRVEPPCPIAGRCGGCDFQHVDPAHARELKRQVVSEVLRHLADFDFVGEVEEVIPSPLGWRSRMRYHLDHAGEAGLKAHRSAEVVGLPPGGCRIADPSIADPPAFPAAAGGELLGIAAAQRSQFVVKSPDLLEPVVEVVGERQFEVATSGFWQAHRAAPGVLTDRVIEGLKPLRGELALDLYCGVGVFAGALASRGVGVWGVDADRVAVDLAATNVPDGRFIAGDVSRRMPRLPDRADLVVLDPPRTGAGAKVMAGLVSRRPRRVAYVACDPAALGRDLRIATKLGYRTRSVEALDLYPLTHHIECVAVLEPR